MYLGAEVTRNKKLETRNSSRRLARLHACTAGAVDDNIILIL